MVEDTPFMRSLAIQGRVIGALLMREIITRYGRHNIGVLWLFAEPMMFTLGVTAIWSLIRTSHGSDGMSVTGFALTGYSSVLLWRNTVGRCNIAITPNLSLMYHRNVRVIDIFAARIILEESGVIISFITLSLVFISIDWLKPPDDILKVILAFGLLSWFGASLAILMGALSERSDAVEKIWHPISYLMFPLSGAAFMVEWLPPAYREAVLWIPMVHGTELLREGYFGSAVRAHYDIAYLSIICLCMTLIGLALVKGAMRHMEYD
jgi:ABC-type polysaccharide/polyol phosphate export permease